jgi:hypothetical protein
MLLQHLPHIPKAQPAGLACPSIGHPLAYKEDKYGCSRNHQCHIDRPQPQIAEKYRSDFPADEKALNSMASAICLDLLMAPLNIGRIDVFRHNHNRWIPRQHSNVGIPK